MIRLLRLTADRISDAWLVVSYTLPKLRAAESRRLPPFGRWRGAGNPSEEAGRFGCGRALAFAVTSTVVMNSKKGERLWHLTRRNVAL